MKTDVVSSKNKNDFRTEETEDLMSLARFTDVGINSSNLSVFLYLY